MIDFDWSFPYPSQRMPVMARNMVATSQPLAAQAGLQMLREGGNAVDAAVATAIALTVVEPAANGIGSDNFALIWKDGKLHGMNASGRSPAALTAESCRGLDSVPLYDWRATTVPGAISGWKLASEQFGALPFAKLFEPAIEYAQSGFQVSPQTSRSWRSAQRRYQHESWHATFAPDGRGPRPGELFRSPGHARTLQMVAALGPDVFYKGELGDKLVAFSKADGGFFAKSDLEAHEAEWVEPISIDYHGYRLHEIPPNGQGLAALIMLGIMRHLRAHELQVDCPDVVHLQIEAMKLALADAHRYIADPAYMDVKVEDLLHDGYLASRAQLISPSKASDVAYGEPKIGGTVLLCAADAQGMMVSFIQSNYTGFGSGLVVPETGIALQNRGGCFTVEPGHPNEIGPKKKPFHTIIPGFVTKDDQPVMAFGVMGGGMQPQGHAQVMIRMVDYQQNPQAALDAPRWQVFKDGRVGVEPGFSEDVYTTLKARGHNMFIPERQSVTYGGAQTIYRVEDGYIGASDLRRDGQAVGF